MTQPDKLFSHQETYEGDWEVTMCNHKGGRKAHHVRRMCLCTHEDDAKCIAEALEAYEKQEPRVHIAEYWVKSNG